MTGVVVGIAGPGETVVRNFVPFFACDFARFAADADCWISEKTDLDPILHVSVPALIRTLDSFADHTGNGVAEYWSIGVVW
jgi:hypothetical protein